MLSLFHLMINQKSSFKTIEIGLLLHTKILISDNLTQVKNKKLVRLKSFNLQSQVVICTKKLMTSLDSTRTAFFEEILTKEHNYNYFIMLSLKVYDIV